MTIAGRRAVGVDVGGTAVKAVRVRFDGEGRPEVEDRARHVFRDAERDEEGTVEVISTLARALGAGAEVVVGIAIAGGVRLPEGRVTASANFPLWRNFDVGRRVSSQLGTRVRVGNDANLFALAEARAGAARGLRHVLALTLGTGLGGGLVIGGRLHEGAHGIAAEAGHVPFLPDGHPCGCGSRGCIEQYASTLFLRREASRRGVEGAGEWTPEVTGRILADRARGGDPVARAIFGEMGGNLGTVVGGFLNLLDVEAVIVGGGLAEAWDLFGDTLEKVARERAFPDVAVDVLFLRPELGSDAGSVGAAIRALDD